MKAQKRLNVILVVLIIVLVSIISFVGIFYQSRNEMVSRIPEYKSGTNIKGHRIVTLEVSEDGKTSGEESTENKTTENEVAENETSNNAESKNKENNTDNYKKSAEIIKKRLKNLKVEDYSVSLDENTGKIEIDLPENDQTDIILSDITQKGNFQIADSSTNEVLLSNSDVKSVDVGKQVNGSYSVVYMNINFNMQGAKKFKNVTVKYQNNVSENTIAAENTSEENTTTTENSTEKNSTSEENIAKNTTSDESSDSSNKSRQVVLKIDDTTMMTTSFTEVIDNGTLSLTIGSSKDNDEIQTYVYGGDNLAAIIENEAMPLQYEIKGNTYVASELGTSNIKIIVYVEIAIALVISLYLIIRYRAKGIMATILSVGYVAVLLLIIRYANVVLSIEGILAIALSFVVNTVFNIMLLNRIKEKNMTAEEKRQKYNEALKRYSLSIIPIVIIAIVCCLVNWDAIYSFGMVMFWGIIISIIYNLTFTNVVVKNSK